MYEEEDLVPISALQHLLFCQRQAALIHVEGLWAENRLTVEGQHLHQKAHDGPSESRHSVRISRGLPIRSLRLGLSGVADVVEWYPPPEGQDAPIRPYPVEYKRGRSKQDGSDSVQLCAQAMCLEEMLDLSVPEGALFYGQTRRRQVIPFTIELRKQVKDAAVRMHELIAIGQVPRVRREPKCDSCSMLHLCLPGGTAPRKSVKRYLDASLIQLSSEG